MSGDALLFLAATTLGFPSSQTRATHLNLICGDTQCVLRVDVACWLMWRVALARLSRAHTWKIFSSPMDVDVAIQGDNPDNECGDVDIAADTHQISGVGRSAGGRADGVVLQGLVSVCSPGQGKRRTRTTMVHASPCRQCGGLCGGQLLTKVQHHI